MRRALQVQQMHPARRVPGSHLGGGLFRTLIREQGLQRPAQRHQERRYPGRGQLILEWPRPVLLRRGLWRQGL